MNIKPIYKVLIIVLANFNLFFLSQSSAQCTLQVFPNIVNNECQGQSNGIASAVGIFGTPPYTAVHTNSVGSVVDTDTNLLQGQASTANGLTQGNYTVTFTDATGTCTIPANYTIGVIVVDNSTALSGETITANATGATYRWLDCNNGMAVIPGETGNSYTATSNGNYAVEVTVNGCIENSSCVLVATLGVTENEFSSTFKMYPNPVKTILKVVSKTDATYSIINQLGQEIKQFNSLANTVNEINVENLPKGIYFIKNNKSKYCKKIVIE